ncbi:hypothetical protein TNCT_279991 [Trichonephila clavata]|uniref:Uncharacterized protein n=1 Tax=Trichonephila clavata TaxID=2740835 RepID=A0A8X6FF36_TRICU|nr:hypothetical protein TNCT_279991 [Trichonephila clavata]
MLFLNTYWQFKTISSTNFVVEISDSAVKCHRRTTKQTGDENGTGTGRKKINSPFWSSEKRGQNDKADQSYNKDQRSHRNMGWQAPVEGAGVQTRAEQKENEFIRVVDALGVTWLVTRTANWLTCI